MRVGDWIHDNLGRAVDLQGRCSSSPSIILDRGEQDLCPEGVGSALPDGRTDRLRPGHAQAPSSRFEVLDYSLG
jgi:hypothetical protein